MYFRLRLGVELIHTKSATKHLTALATESSSQSERERETDRQTDRQADTQIGMRAGIQAERHELYVRSQRRAQKHVVQICCRKWH